MPTTQYQCDNCGADIKRSEKYCHECGIQLDWPEPEDGNKTIENVSKKEQSSVGGKLNEINSCANTTLGLSILAILFGYFGIIFGTAILIHSIIIKRKSKNHYSHENKSKIRKHLNAISIDAVILLVLTIISMFGSVSQYAGKNIYGQYRYGDNWGTYLAISIIFHIIGIIVTAIINKKAKAAQGSLE